MSNDHWLLHRIDQEHSRILGNLHSEKTRRKLKAYLWLHSNPQPLTPAYQTKFRYYYSLRGRKQPWVQAFFNLLAASMGAPPTYSQVLSALSSGGSVEGSFASKFLATIDPTMPVLDSIVIRNLGLNIPSSKSRQTKINDWIALHQTVSAMYATIASQTMFLPTLNQFLVTADLNSIASISPVKLLDVVLWQLR